ncbi:uncharacterized protein N7511_009411 [Penicillium nucicola]|uniref:uncharacterized protein n=1 Tax=Penicillium nucicola TaxID=1850975 RepID=UPI0025452CDB|nr:uncharacterized protein N7511_009411 [Penicillium nucicola]KAJ5747715.1 hypothetical protein N7511_009411 [Penicillium nucicola]
MEQAILAGEAGCISISPFLHELKIQMVPGYLDKNPIFDVCVKAQKFYRDNNLPTRVKACATLGLDELLMLAGVDALTIMPDDLKALSECERDETELNNINLFVNSEKTQDLVNYPSFIDSEKDYRVSFAYSDEGQAQFKTAQAIAFFCEVQTKAEFLIKSQVEHII